MGLNYHPEIKSLVFYRLSNYARYSNCELNIYQIVCSVSALSAMLFSSLPALANKHCSLLDVTYYSQRSIDLNTGYYTITA